MGTIALPIGRMSCSFTAPVYRKVSRDVASCRQFQVIHSFLDWGAFASDRPLFRISQKTGLPSPRQALRTKLQLKGERCRALSAVAPCLTHIGVLTEATQEAKTCTTAIPCRSSNPLEGADKADTVKKPEVVVHEHERRKGENAVLRKQYETLTNTDSLVKRWIAIAAEFLHVTANDPKPNQIPSTKPKPE
jgi:hypothetical protein